jgi:hypothetical protein
MDQHYVPQFYLRLFRDPAAPTGMGPRVWVGDLKNETVALRAPKAVGKSVGFYTFTDDEGKPSDDIEDLLQAVDSDAAGSIAKILDGEYALASADIVAIAGFMAFFVTRVPVFRVNVDRMADLIMKTWLREATSDPEAFDRMFRKANTGVTLAPEEVEEARQYFAATDRYTVALGQLGLKLMVSQGPQLARLLAALGWGFLVAKTGCFITSDSPVLWADPGLTGPLAFGLARSGVQLTFPLSPRIALFGTWGGPAGGVEADAGQVAAVNFRTAFRADRYLFGDHNTEVAEAMRRRKEAGLT